MKQFHSPKIEEAGTFLLSPLLVFASLIPDSCSTRQSQKSSNKTPTVGATVSSRTEKTSFDVRGGRRMEEVTIGTGATRQTMRSKGDLGFIVVELRLREENQHDPVPANFSGVELVDSAGARYKPLYSYPAALSKCGHDCETITFADDPSRLVGRRLSEFDGRLVVVFSAPKERSEFKVKIANSPPVEIRVGGEK
jgi:hypothetical protein